MKNLILIFTLSLIVAACDDSTKETAKNATEKTVKTTKEAVKNTTDKAVEVTKEAVDTTKEMVKNTTETAVEVTKEAVETTSEKAKEVAKDATEIADKAKTAVIAATDKATTVIDKNVAMVEAKGITKAFASSLKAALQKAMQDGGPVNALSVCNKEAMLITAKVAQDHGAMVSRVSLKNRNPKNTPSEWQKAVLENFDTLAAMGENVEKMGFSEVIEKDGKNQLRFMKALPTGGLCLNCHGANISPDVQAKLTELYPEDKATGYSEGQVRGAIVVIKDMQ